MSVNGNNLSGLSPGEPQETDGVARQLRKLSFRNSGRVSSSEFKPEHSTREMRKMSRKIYSETGRKTVLFDEHGCLFQTDRDLCDCLDPDCSGCHFPCMKCSSTKCGHECRCNRRWVYDQIEIEGTGIIIKNKEA